ncbi:helix-turn-helix domain-containing protein [Salmonella enterica subsp. enterica serovar Vitkin]|uniref:Helix-turn-helix domain-containing protein n=9 Tax=Salmonella enterica TaxID=28901 RepID=A0A734CEB1_SALET|nr:MULTISPECIES: helix-turn-helix domain-containing protein [Salmonella]EAA1529159.1 helix-turn-helix domain-containing protein [Salmonella enterica subsp. enterica serovar Tennessee]EAA3558451.1 helix-turn-helix domain-containing protein [Salmonella enterica subsp. enterica serovar Montevideo]EAB6357853.1 helix-turn-helix domain-containing protein [Salmonella enterica subsp. enterica]EAB8210407.1 helix-turn-helix domain-containing protein [Salmonella enterica subsp. enterica serovar Lattenkamp
MKNETFGARLLARRKKLKLSQAALGKLVKVAHVTISQWERDETQPAGKRLFSLSQALQCSPTWLLFGDEEKQPAEPIAPPPDLRDDQKELLKLYEALPESEQKAQLEGMRARVENFNKLFDELLKARKRSSKS